MNRKVKSEIALAGLTNRALARKIGVSEEWLSKVIHGHKKSDRVRKAIADALGVPVTDLWPKGNGNNHERKVA